MNKIVIIKDHVPDLCEEFGYLSIEPKGRLGNFISQYATLYGYAKYYGISPVIHPFMRDGLRHMFKHISIPVYTNKTCKSPFYCEVENNVLSARLLKSADCNFFITGHPRWAFQETFDFAKWTSRSNFINWEKCFQFYKQSKIRFGGWS